jgi:hypothetical protein
MATKQFKIGERAIGGIIKVDIEKTLVTVSALEYYTKKEICLDLNPKHDFYHCFSITINIFLSNKL